MLTYKLCSQRDTLYSVGLKTAKYKILVGQPEGKRPLGKSKHRWEDNIRMDLREIGWEDVTCMHLTQDRDQWPAFVNTVMNLGFP
jgi:hypothetical protein